MFKKFLYLILFVCLCVGFSNAQAQLKVDFGLTTSPVQSGYEAYTATHEVPDTFTAQTFDAFGTTVTIKPTWEPDAEAACMQMYDRGLENYEDETENLMRDWIGSDTRSAGDPLTLTISGLPKGMYSWLSFHTDTEATTDIGTFDVTVNDASGSVTTTDIQCTNNATTTFDGVAKFSATFVSNGTDDVSFVFDLQPYTNQYNEAWFVMNGFEIESLSPLNTALNPSPKNGDTDVSIDVGEIAWVPGEFANTHNVFFGTDPNKVENATVADDLGVAVYPDLPHDSNSITLDRLEYGTTYYWRVDEVNDPANPGTYKGRVWGFTTELIAYPLGSEHITATASAPAYEAGSQDPNDTCNGAGIDDFNDTHSVDPATMYLCDITSGPGWLQYEFDKSYRLYDMLIWNYNEEDIGADLGAKDVNIAYSEDGETWSDLSGTFVIEKAPGDNTCGPNPPILFDGKVVKYVKLTLNTNYIGFIASAGISEVRFSTIPKRASEPDPSDNASNIDINPTLSWKSGRGAIEHNVYLDTDEAAVEGGTADSETVAESSYTSATLMLDTTYYWRVDEVNSLADYPTWSSDVWSFSTVDSIVADNFEDYNDTQPYTVWDTWIDGITDSANGGSRMGHEYEPFCELDIVRSGEQSAPMHYDNTAGTFSQVVASTSNLAAGSNWSAGGADTFAIWFRGTETNVATDQIYAKINDTKFVYDGPASDISRTAWTKFEIPLAGMNLSNVTSVTIGVERIGVSGGSGDIYLDDIELIIGVEAVEPAPGNLVAHYDMENNLLDSSGNGLNGEPNGVVSYAAGKSGMALVLDGNDAYVDLPIGDLVSTLTDCTISTWVNWTPGDTSQWSRVFDFGTGTATNWFLTPETNSNQIRAAIKLSDAVGEQQADGNAGILEANNWQHLAVVIETGDPNTMKLYLNGDLIGTRNNLTTLPRDLGVTTQNYLGKSQWSDPYFNGMIDDFRIYDRAFTAGEVKYLFKN